MTRALRHLLLPALFLSLTGCGLVTKALKPHPKEDEDDKKPKDVFIGVIEMVNPEQHFVLIRMSMQLKLESGWKLETRPVSGNKSVLAITPEQKLNYLTADITEGYPQQGEIVVLPPQAGLTATQPAVSSDGAPPSGQTPSAPTQAPAPATPFRAPSGEVLPPPIR